MVVVASDISLVLSGGSVNMDPNASLGGNPSSQPIIGVLNNLFDDVSQGNVDAGHIDHRCFYIFNNNSNSSLDNVDLIIQSQIADGASAKIGVEFKTDIQQIKIDGDPTAGTFELTYTGPIGLSGTIIVSHDADLATWASNLQTALNSHPELSGVTITTTAGVSTRSFFVNFQGDDDNRFQELLVVDSNDLTPASTMAITEIQNGSPLNAIAPLVASETIPPTGVIFSDADSTSPVSVGKLIQGDGVPVWVERTTADTALAVTNDGFTLRIVGNPI